MHESASEFFQADVLWMVAILSVLFSFFYVIYLFKKLSKDLDQCDFYHEKDQDTYDKIIEVYPNWKDDSSIEIGGKPINRRLTSFELD